MLLSKLFLFLAECFGRMGRELIPALFNEARKPRVTKVIGNDEKIKRSIDDSIAERLRLDAKANKNRPPP